MSKAAIVGWDIGGAHLKLAVLDANGGLLAIEQRPCALWRGLNVLANVMKSAVHDLRLQNARHFATMTGELVDLFDNRAQGVQQIADCASAILGPDARFYAAGQGWVSAAQTGAATRFVASANWHASATWLAQYIPHALLVDIGSTTTDIIPIENGKVALSSVSDADRMRDDSLVYTGVVRTPIMALAQKLPVNGVEMNVAAEYFATTADVYRLLGELNPQYDMAETADGKGKAARESARRLARMVGHDVEDKPLEVWQDLANTCKHMQMQQIKTAIQQHLHPQALIVGAGAGEFLVRAIAHSVGHAYEQVSMRLPGLPSAALIGAHADYGPCLPAYAVAKLAVQHA